VAVVGEAFIVIKPITASFGKDVKDSLDGLDNTVRRAGARAGKVYGGAFGKAFGPTGAGIFSNDFIKKAVSAQKAYASFTRTAFFVQTTLSTLLSTLGSVVTAIISLGSAVAGAIPALVSLGSAFVSLGLGALAAKLALGGVGAAVQKYNQQQKKSAKDTTAAQDRVDDAYRRFGEVVERNKERVTDAYNDMQDATKDAEEAQLDYNKALEEANETIQQLGFDAEDAALAEQKAALELEKARENLQRVQDLPPNSRARKEAELAYAEAELNLRKAKDRNSDLAKEQERLAKTGPEGVEAVIDAGKKLADAKAKELEAQQKYNKTIIDGARDEADAKREIERAERDLKKAKEGDGGDDPFAGLTDSQEDFAKFIISLKPKIDELKEAIASQLLPKLKEAISLLANGEAFEVFKTGLAEIGSAVGDAAKEIAAAIAEPGNLKDLETVLQNSADNIRIIGSIAGNVWGIFLSVLVAAQPVTERLLKWLDEFTEKWETKLDTPEGLQALTDFFNLAGDIAAEIGDVLRETFGAIGTTIKANFSEGGAGWFILDWLEDVLKGFNDFGKSVEGQKELQQFFLDSAKNATAAFESIGAFVKEIMKAGADPNVKIFWDTLKQAAPYFGNILEKSNAAAPSLAELFVKILRIVDLLTDSGQMTTFFETLNVAAGIVIKILENPFVAALLKVIGQVSGFFLALGAVAGILSGIGSIISGVVIVAFNVLTKVFNIAKGVITVFRIAWMLLSAAFAANPIGVIIIAITALIALFVTLYNKNEAFRELVDKVWAAIKDAIGAAWDFIKGVFEKIIEIGKALWDPIFDFLKAVWDKVKAYFETIFTIWKTLVEIFIGIGLIIWNFLYDKIVAVWETVKGWWDNTILPFITGIVTTVAEFGAAIWNWIYDKIMAVWETVKGFWDKTIYPFVSGIVNNVKNRASAIWNFVSDALTTVWNKVKGFWDNTIYPFISGIKAKITSLASGLWDGLKSGLSGVANFIINVLNKVIDGINLLIKGANAVKVGDDIPLLKPIPPVNFAKGGTVFPSPGGTLARVAEAGRPERIEPLDPDGLSKRDKAMIQMLAGGAGGGATINVYPSQGMNETELAEIVSRKIAFMMRKGAVA